MTSDKIKLKVVQKKFTNETRWICTYCCKQLKNKQSYDYHLNNSVCKKYRCYFCERIFSNQKSLRHHIDKRLCLNTHKIKIDAEIKPDGVIKVCKSTAAYTDLDISELVTKVTLPVFMETIFSQTFANVIPEFIKISLCNKLLPEYWSVFISNKGDRSMNIHNGIEWQLITKKTFFPQIIEWSLDMLTLFTARYTVELTDDQIEYIDRLKAIVETNYDKILVDIHEELHCIFYNHKILCREKNRNSKRVSEE